MLPSNELNRLAIYLEPMPFECLAEIHEYPIHPKLWLHGILCRYVKRKNDLTLKLR